MEKNLQNAKVRKIDNDVLIPMLRELVESGQEVRMTVSGNSMSPLICHSRDSVILTAPKGPLKKGDIPFYQRTSGQYVLHRICKVDKNGKIYCIGDAQTQIEGPLEPTQVFAVVKSINRKGRWIGPDSFTWWFFAHVWLNVIPFRRLILAVYGKIRSL